MGQINEKNIANAVYLLAKEQKSQNVVDDLRFLVKSVKEVSEFRYFLFSSVKISEKENLIKKSFPKVGDVAVKSFLTVIRYNLLKKVNKIISIVESLQLEESSSKKAVVESVVKMNKSQITKLKDVLSKRLDKSVEIENVINSKVKGGLKIKISDLLIDVSVAGKIKQLKNNLQ